jgi:hypothetical protein
MQVVIWSVKGVPFPTGSSEVSIFVSGSIMHDDGTADKQDTDVHYKSKDGTGRWVRIYLFYSVLDTTSLKYTLNSTYIQVYLIGGSCIA